MAEGVARGWRRIVGPAFRAAAVALALAGCASSGGGEPQTRANRSVAEQRQGQQAHPQVLRQFGGAYDDARLSAYVRDLGMKLAAASEQPDLPWTFTVLDSPVINAFALPGGYVYVSRGLIALADDEAELAGVIGHEIGHVTASHGARRQTQSTVAQAGVMAAVLGAALLGAEGPLLDAVGQGASAVAQGGVASFSRAQELEADRLGVRYLARAGYDPLAQADFLNSMSEQQALSARLAGGAHDPTRVDFFATHPADADRVREAVAEARAQGVDVKGGARERDRFLNAVDGMTYGDSAAQGFVRGRRFVHPQLRFAFEAPPGFEIVNSAAQVRTRGPNGATVIFDGVRDPGGPLDRIVARDWPAALAREARVGQVESVERFSANGLEAATAVLPVQTRRGVAAAHLTAIRGGDGTLYRFTALADPRDRAGREAAESMGRSFRRLSAAEAARERPDRLTVHTVRAGETVRSLAAATPHDRAAEERFRVLNGLAPGREVRPGDRVKLVRR
jgi:predicted Zn-dependent protease